MRTASGMTVALAMILSASLAWGQAKEAVKMGFSAAVERLPQIIGWALVSATVGVLLQVIQSRRNRAGRIAAGILGAAWTFVTFLVVPILVVERKGPIQAVKESARLLKQTWGEQLIGNFSFGGVFFLLSLPGMLLLGGGIALAHGVIGGAPMLGLGIPLIVLGVLYLLLCGLIQSTLATIFRAALYLYARDGRVPEGFSEGDLGAAMTGRERHGLREMV